MKNWTIALRIGVALSLIGVLAAIGGIVALVALVNTRTKTETVASSYVPGIIDISRAYFNTLENTSFAYRHILTKNPADMKALIDAMEANAVEQRGQLADFEKRLNTEEIRAQLGQMTTVRDKYMVLRDKALDMSAKDEKDAAYVFIGKEVAPLGAKYREAVEKIIDTAEKGANTAAGDAARIARLGLVTGLSCFVVAAVAGILSSYFVVRGINRSLRTVADSLGQASEQVSSASGQVSSSSQTLAQGASEQAASLEETTASVEEINSMTKRNAENAQNAKSIAQDTRHAADRGTQQMDEMVTAMNAIKESSDNIAKIVKSIDEIAFQTNILALNAAVEAARAGEAGMGFAVVADEVRNLAQRAAQAARETAAKIDDSIQKSAAGVEISSRVAESLKEIAEKARKVDELVADIATASQEQTQGLGQISQAMSQMDHVTQSNASSAEESAAAAEELNAQSLTMLDNVGELLRLVGGAKAVASRATQHSTRKPAAASHEKAPSAPKLAFPKKTASSIALPVAAGEPAGQSFKEI